MAVFDGKRMGKSAEHMGKISVNAGKIIEVNGGHHHGLIHDDTEGIKQWPMRVSHRDLDMFFFECKGILVRGKL